MCHGRTLVAVTHAQGRTIKCPPIVPAVIGSPRARDASGLDFDLLHVG